ncbi:MAG: hypothetical protein JSV45_12135 [Chromatiales bacterium]|nr:MAG: hypothetical protein JSV45_12135 [Chromatiales bacterium]
MTRFEPESVARWLDDLDCAAGALRLLWGWRSARRPGMVSRLILPLLVSIVLALGPNVGI